MKVLTYIYYYLLIVTIINCNGISLCRLDAEVKERNSIIEDFWKRQKKVFAESDKNTFSAFSIHSIKLFKSLIFKYNNLNDKEKLVESIS